MQFITDRIKEPSTWAALSALSVFVGLPVGSVDAVQSICVGVCSLAAIIMRERAK